MDVMPTHSTSDVGSEPRVEDRRKLRATLRVRPDESTGCALGSAGSGGDVIAHDVVCADGDCDPGCECRASVEIDGEIRMVGRRIGDGCVCPVFRSHDCVSSIEAVENGELVIDVVLRSRDVLTSIVASLRERGAAVELRRITEVGAASSRRRLTIDADAITDKQREAIEAAVEAGYYDTPRRADLSELAERLGVSRSAVSQRLTAAESTLVGALHDLESGLRTE